jgi:hypothetical protein
MARDSLSLFWDSFLALKRGVANSPYQAIQIHPPDRTLHSEKLIIHQDL